MIVIVICILVNWFHIYYSKLNGIFLFFFIYLFAVVLKLSHISAPHVFYIKR